MITMIIMSWTIGYGLTLGLRNTIYRLGGLITKRGFLQNTTGQILDSIWFSCIAFLVMSYQKESLYLLML